MNLPRLCYLWEMYNANHCQKVNFDDLRFKAADFLAPVEIFRHKMSIGLGQIRTNLCIWSLFLFLKENLPKLTVH